MVVFIKSIQGNEYEHVDSKINMFMFAKERELYSSVQTIPTTAMHIIANRSFTVSQEPYIKTPCSGWGYRIMSQNGGCLATFTPWNVKRLSISHNYGGHKVWISSAAIYIKSAFLVFPGSWFNPIPTAELLG